MVTIGENWLMNAAIYFRFRHFSFCFVFFFVIQSNCTIDYRVAWLLIWIKMMLRSESCTRDILMKFCRFDFSRWEILNSFLFFIWLILVITTFVWKWRFYTPPMCTPNVKTFLLYFNLWMLIVAFTATVFFNCYASVYVCSVGVDALLWSVLLEVYFF